MKDEVVIKGKRTVKALAVAGIVVCVLGTLATFVVALFLGKAYALLGCVVTIPVGMMLAEYVGMMD